MRLILRILIGVGIFFVSLIIGLIILPIDVFYITQLSFSAVVTTLIMIATRKKKKMKEQGNENIAP